MYHIRIKPLREVSNQEENNEQPLRALQGPAKERWESSCNLKLGNSYFPNVNKYLTDQVLHLWQIFKPWQSTFLEVGLKMYAKSRKMVNGGSWGGNKEVKGAIQCSCGYVYFSYENVAENVQEDRQVFKKHLGSWQRKIIFFLGGRTLAQQGRATVVCNDYPPEGASRWGFQIKPFIIFQLCLRHAEVLEQGIKSIP